MYVCVFGCMQFACHDKSDYLFTDIFTEFWLFELYGMCDCHWDITRILAIRFVCVVCVFLDFICVRGASHSTRMQVKLDFLPKNFQRIHECNDWRQMLLGINSWGFIHSPESRFHTSRMLLMAAKLYPTYLKYCVRLAEGNDERRKNKNWWEGWEMKMPDLMIDQCWDWFLELPHLNTYAAELETR